MDTFEYCFGTKMPLPKNYGSFRRSRSGSLAMAFGLTVSTGRTAWPERADPRNAARLPHGRAQLQPVKDYINPRSGRHSTHRSHCSVCESANESTHDGNHRRDDRDAQASASGSQGMQADRRAGWAAPPATKRIVGGTSGYVGRTRPNSQAPNPLGTAINSTTPHARVAAASPALTSTQNQIKCCGERRKILAASGKVTKAIPRKRIVMGPIRVLAAWI